MVLFALDGVGDSVFSGNGEVHEIDGIVGGGGYGALAGVMTVDEDVVRTVTTAVCLEGGAEVAWEDPVWDGARR